MTRRIIYFIGFLIALTGVCTAQMRLRVGTGWGGIERAGRWNPLIIRVSNPQPRDALLELLSSTQGGFATVIREHIAVGPNTSTYELVAPRHYSQSERTVTVLRDALTEKLISQSALDTQLTKPATLDLGPQDILIGVSGKAARLELLAQSGAAHAAYMPPRFLPRDAMGYDSLEILFLNQVDLNDIDADQQRAILDWVRAGGSLLFTAGDGTLPRESAIAAALPCRIGTITQVDLTPENLQETGLKEAHWVGRVLTSTSPAARSVELIKEDAGAAWSVRFGLGQILVAPIDLGSLEFQADRGDRRIAAFWKPILGELTNVPAAQPRRMFDAPYNGHQSESEDQQREGAATGTLADLVGGKPLSTAIRIPLILFAMLLVIGPVDSIVLFVIGRRPWTLITTGGWIGLIVLALYAGISAVRQTGANYGTVRVIDQVDDATVATTDVIGLTSPLKGDYTVSPSETKSPGWWQPVIRGIVAPEQIKAQFDATFHESDSGQAPEQQILGAGESRFLRSDREMAAPPVISASLAASAIELNPPRLVGSIKNLFDRPLKDLRIRTKFGVALIPLGPTATLAPQQSVSIDIPATAEPFNVEKQEARYQSYGSFGSHHDQQPVNEGNLWAIAPDLSGRRSLRIDELIGRSSEFACIYAQCIDPSPAASVHGNERPVERYYEYVRALVPLNR